jgi:hypothetical protein
MQKKQASAGKFEMRKGQAAVELMVVLAVSVAVLIAIYSYSATSMIEMNRQKMVDDAQASVNSLEQAANDVYRQGVGATKKVFYTVPNGVEESRSGIEADSFVLNVLGTDVYAKPEVCLQGSLSVEQGGHWVWITAQEDCVFVGMQNIELDKTSSYVTLSQSDSQQDVITVTNNSSEATTVFLAESWLHSDVTLGLSITAFGLAAGVSQPVTLTYASNSSASGNYAGSLGIGASFDSSADQNISLPLNAEIQVLAGGSNLAVFPASHLKGMAASEVDSNSFQVCNNGDSDMTTVSFSDSGGIASWIDAISDISNLLVGECRMVNYTLTVPGGTSGGTYTGTITASDGTYSDTLDISVIVPTVVAGPAYAMFAPTAGTDTTAGSYSLNGGDLSNVSASDNVDYQSQGNWPRNNAGYNEAVYVEYVFSPGLPGGTTISDVNVTHEFATGNPARAIYAKLEVWDGSSWNDEVLMSNQNSNASDVTHTVNVGSYIDTVAEVNGIRVRFLMYVVPNINKDSEQDLVRVGVTYT